MDVSAIRTLTVTAAPHVGDLIWWTLEGARIHRSELEAVWSRAGLAARLLPEPPTAEKALKTAIRDATLGVADHLIRLGKDDRDELVFAVLHESRDLAGNVEHSQIARIQLDRSAAPVLRTDNAAQELVRAVFAGYDRLLHTHTVDDVRRTLLRALDECAAVTLREHGGVYWVPAQFSDTVHRLQAALSEIGKSRMDVVPIHATAEGSRALGHAARQSVETEVASLQVEIAEFIAEPPERTSTLVRRLERCKALKEKAQLYQSVLQVQVQDLETSLDSLAGTVQRLLDDGAQAQVGAHAA